jgi:site-specific DNA-methyltransferase (adenine-specific)
MEYMAGQPDNAFDLAIVDPQYGIGVHKHRLDPQKRATAKWKKPRKANYKTFDDSLPPTAEYFHELRRVSKNQIIWGGNYFTEHLPASMGWIVWDKRVGLNENLSMCELAYSSFNKRCLKFEFLWSGFRKAVQVKRIHPSQKPVQLYEFLLQRYAKPGQRILDTHLGSGSSAIAAYGFGCDFVGCEIDAEFFNTAKERIDAETRQIDLLNTPPTEESAR